MAHGFGHRRFRQTLVGIAALYLAALLYHPLLGFARPVQFFTEATCLFPGAGRYTIEYRLAAWSCSKRAWLPLDPTPYFPIETTNKESRFQRLAHFYQHNKTVMTALDDYIVEHHPSTADGVAGAIGGIRMIHIVRGQPAPGEEVARYHWDPLAPIPTTRHVLNADVAAGKEELVDAFFTPASDRQERCRAR